MNVLQKLITMIRGSARELGEAVVDSQALRITEQEIIDAKSQLEDAKGSLAQVVAKRMAEERNVNELNKQKIEYETHALSAVEQNNEALALEVAAKVGDLEVQLGQKTSVVNQYTDQANRLKNQIETAEKNIAEYQRELDMVSTTASVQKATAQVTSEINSQQSALSSARESLERIKEKQQQHDDLQEAKKEVDASLKKADLDTQLKEAGIKVDSHSAGSVLERIKQQAKDAE